MVVDLPEPFGPRNPKTSPHGKGQSVERHDIAEAAVQ
jgi:hypothetical protein